MRAPGGSDPSAPAADPHHDPPAERQQPPGRRAQLAELVAVAAVLTLVAAATMRAVSRGWLAIGDNALFLIRARDVMTEHHPLLGTWTSASVSVGEHLNNPGPLFFEWLALPARLWGDTGVAVGTAALNAAAIVVMVVIAHRRLGPMGGAAAALAAAALAWATGSALLFDPWQPHSLLFPFLAFLTAVWALADGQGSALFAVVTLGSLLVQTHMSYAVLVPVLAAVGLAGWAVALNRRRRDEPGGWPAARRSTIRITALSVAVLIALWVQPVVEQVTADGGGNIAALARSSTASEETLGFGLAARVTADAVALPPFWAPPSFEKALVPERGRAPLSNLPSTSLAVAALSLVIALLLAVAVVARNRRRSSSTAAVVSGVPIVLAAVTVAVLPEGWFGLAAHQIRWLWPIGVFATVALALAAATFARPVPATVGFAVLTVVACLGALPRDQLDAGPSADRSATEVLREVRSELGDVERLGGVILFETRGLRFGEPYSTPLMAELQRRGVPFVVDDAGWASQLGPDRLHRGEAEHRLLVAEGDAAVRSRPGARRIAFATALTAAERRELIASEPEVSALVEMHGLTLNEAGDEALARGQLPVLKDTGSSDPARLVASGELASAIHSGWVDFDPEQRELFERYADLHLRWARLTVGVFLEPIAGGR